MKNIGIDIVKKERITNELIQRFMSEREIQLMNTYKSEETKQEFAAGRWALKESIIKASDQKILYSQIEVLKDDFGKPIVYIDGENPKNIKVSISHEDNYSVAVAVIE